MTAAPPFELPAELAVDTDVARRVIADFIRGQLRPGGLRAGRPRPLGRHRFGARRVSRRRGDRRRAAAGGDDAVSDVVARVAGRRRDRGRRARAARARSSRSRRWSTGISAPTERRERPATAGAGRRRPPAGQLRRPDADVGPVRPVRDVGRPRRGDRQQDRVADRLHDAVRRLGVRVQPDRRPVQEPGAPAVGGDGRSRRDRPQGAVGRPVAGPDRRDRGRLQLPGPRPAAVLADRQAPLARGDGSRSGSSLPMVERVDRMVAGAEFKRQVPPIAKLGPRTAGVDYLYPRRRPGSARA